MEKKNDDISIAVVRVRGNVRQSYDIEKTFASLNLHNKNWCILLDNNPSNIGMIKKVKDFITWGEISKEMVTLLITKRGEVESTGKKSFNFEGKKYKRYFRLTPPKKGYGRKGIKISYTDGGALGYRGEKINDLLKRMI
jgi:large subunit ribosomal protein L30